MNTREYSKEEVIKFAKEAYETGDVKFEIIPGKCALLVIDMQDEFVKPGWTPYWVPETTKIIPKIKDLIDTCRKKNIPVIFTTFASTHKFFDRPKTGSLMPNRYKPDGIINPEWFDKGNIWHELAPSKEDIIIYKASYGAFFDTSLETILKNLDRDTIIITGTLTNYCCGMTARQGYERGFKVIFGSDLNATDNFEMHENELKVLRKGFAKILTLKEIVSYIE
jgi:nicotinamidase-related amidase